MTEVRDGERRTTPALDVTNGDSEDGGANVDVDANGMFEDVGGSVT